jgi:PLP dependent protein
MHNSIKRYQNISNLIKLKLEDKKINKFPKIIAVSKTFSIEKILPLIEYGHTDYGENKVQEAVDKWTKIKIDNSNIKLHMIGKLQTNKVKFAIQIFDFIHSVDSKKLAKKISDEQIKQNRELKLFIQVNIGNEEQKAGIDKSELVDLYKYCKELNLNIIGLMCIPPVNLNVEKYFIQTNLLNKELNLFELSMGMSSDYLKAVEHSSSYLRIGSSIFGKRV